MSYQGGTINRPFQDRAMAFRRRELLALFDQTHEADLQLLRSVARDLVRKAVGIFSPRRLLKRTRREPPPLSSRCGLKVLA